MRPEAHASGFIGSISSGLVQHNPSRSTTLGCAKPNVAVSQTSKTRRCRWLMATPSRANGATAVAPKAVNKWRGMTLHFVALEVSRDKRNSKELNDYIVERLEEEGDPVRWAIVAADEEKGTCFIEAVVSRYGQRAVSKQLSEFNSPS